MLNAFLLEVPPQAATEIGRAFVALMAASFGVTVGSFLNVCIWRMPREGLGVGKPRRSFCPLCGSVIAWFDNLPVLSWIALRGRCRSCRGPISMRYPMVEVMTAVLFVVVADRFLFEVGGGAWGLAFLLALLSALIVGSLIDMDLRILPNEITVGGMHVLPLAMLLLPELRIGPVGDSVHRLLDLVAAGSSGVRSVLPDAAGSTTGAGVVLAIAGLALFAGGYCVYRSWRRRRHPDEEIRWFDLSLAGLLSAAGGCVLLAVILRPDWALAAPLVSTASCLLGMLTGSVLVWLVGVVGTRVFRKPAMGFGDVKLMGLLGGLTGWTGACVGFLGACLLGSVWGIGRLMIVRDRYIPFGPFLTISCLVLYLWPGFFPSLVDWYLGLLVPGH